MRRATVLLAVLITGAGGVARAQTAVVVKRRPVIPAHAPPPPVASPVRPFPPAAPARLSLTGLRSPGDGGSTCRSTCARSRYACEVQGESCAPQWSSCLKTCSDLATVPASPLLPR